MPSPTTAISGWFAMLFAAGMGIGLMFFGVSEPMSHFASSMGGTAVEGGVRTDWAPLGAAAGDADGGPRPGHGRDHLPLGAAPLGDLRRRGAWRWRSSPSTRACR